MSAFLLFKNKLNVTKVPEASQLPKTQSGQVEVYVCEIWQTLVVTKQIARTEYL